MHNHKNLRNKKYRIKDFNVIYVYVAHWGWFDTVFNFFCRIGEKKIFYLQKNKFAVDTVLHVLGCLKYDFLNFEKCLPICEGQIFCGKYSSKSNAPILLKLYVQLHPDLNWCLSTFGRLIR